SPFTPRPPGFARAHWVRPELVGEVTFTEWTADGKMRHPSFQGLREDKPATAVVREVPTTPEAAAADPPRPARSGSPRGRRHRERGSSAAMVAGVRLTHPDRVVYPVQKTTKRALALFYESIADRILPHLVDR